MAARSSAPSRLVSLTLALLSTLVAACGSDPAATASPAIAGQAAPTLPLGGQTAAPGQPVTGQPAAPAGQAGQAAPPTAAATLPCGVTEILKGSCQSCHAAIPNSGAPMPLVTWADLNAPAHSNPARKVYQLVGERVPDRARPMPPDPTQRLSDASIGTLQTWIGGGAQPGAACPISTTGPVTGAAGAAATAGTGIPAAGSGGTPGAVGAAGAAGGPIGEPNDAALDADIEKCYELRAHGQPSVADATGYSAPLGETYTGFIFKAPWTQPVQGLRFRHLADNAAILHHWLLYTESASFADGAIEACQLSGPTGFLCGQATTRGLITGWAPGRGEFRLPAEVGLELPAPGTLLALEAHYYNSTNGPATDKSGVEICVTSKFRKNTASVTWLGSQQINVPGGTTGTAMGTCRPLRSGMNATDPIHVLYSWPHMHKLGTHMKSIVTRAAGTQDLLYDGEFSFNFQVLHDTPLMLMPGDTVTTTCTYENTTNSPVTFGQSTTQEMCYNFTYAWPAHALDNPGAELGGSTNTCLH